MAESTGDIPFNNADPEQQERNPDSADNSEQVHQKLEALQAQLPSSTAADESVLQKRNVSFGLEHTINEGGTTTRGQLAGDVYQGKQLNLRAGGYADTGTGEQGSYVEGNWRNAQGQDRAYFQGSIGRANKQTTAEHIAVATGNKEAAAYASYTKGSSDIDGDNFRGDKGEVGGIGIRANAPFSPGGKHGFTLEGNLKRSTTKGEGIDGHVSEREASGSIGLQGEALGGQYAAAITGGNKRVETGGKYAPQNLDGDFSTYGAQLQYAQDNWKIGAEHSQEIDGDSETSVRGEYSHHTGSGRLDLHAEGKKSSADGTEVGVGASYTFGGGAADKTLPLSGNAFAAAQDVLPTTRDAIADFAENNEANANAILEEKKNQDAAEAAAAELAAREAEEESQRQEQERQQQEEEARQEVQRMFNELEIQEKGDITIHPNDGIVLLYNLDEENKEVIKDLLRSGEATVSVRTASGETSELEWSEARQRSRSQSAGESLLRLQFNCSRRFIDEDVTISLDMDGETRDILHYSRIEAHPEGSLPEKEAQQEAKEIISLLTEDQFEEFAFDFQRNNQIIGAFTYKRPDNILPEVFAKLNKHIREGIVHVEVQTDESTQRFTVHDSNADYNSDISVRLKTQNIMHAEDFQDRNLRISLVSDGYRKTIMSYGVMEGRY